MVHSFPGQTRFPFSFLTWSDLIYDFVFKSSKFGVHRRFRLRLLEHLLSSLGVSLSPTGRENNVPFFSNSKPEVNPVKLFAVMFTLCNSNNTAFGSQFPLAREPEFLGGHLMLSAALAWRPL